MTDQGQSGYYQAIAREFLSRRGAPFFLSPRDLAVIAGWESDRIPLRVVLEGLARAFESFRERPQGTKGLTLAFCDSQVRKAMAQHADRRAGRPRRGDSSRPRKAERARRETERCLLGLAEGEAELRTLLQQALRLLAHETVDEPALEKIDEDVDELLWSRAPRDERDRKRAGELSESAAAARLRLVKDERRKRKIAYVSLYYY